MLAPGATRGVASPKIECTHLYSTKMANSRGRSRSFRKGGGAGGGGVGGGCGLCHSPKKQGVWGPPEAVGFYMLTGALFTVS